MTVRAVTPVRVTAASIGVVGAALLAGCSSAGADAAGSSGSAAPYTDGTYTAEGISKITEMLTQNSTLTALR